MPRFDWYAATIRDDAQSVLGLLEGHVPGSRVIDLGKGKNGYTMGHQIKVDDSVFCTVYSGGTNGNPHAFASGDDSPAFASLVRDLWPVQRDRKGAPIGGHHVTRMDAALDYEAPGAFDRLSRTGLDLVDELEYKKNRKIKVTHYTGHRPEDGRTLYIGSFKSAVLVRIYEKGKEIRSRAIDDAADVSDDWVRFEVQVRPEREARFRAAEGTPLEAFGYSDWSKELLYRVEGLEVERVHRTERRESDHERAMYWLMRQYGDHLATEAENVGGWDKLGPALLARFQAGFPDDAAPSPDLGHFKNRAPGDAEGRDYMQPRPPTDRPF